MGACCASKAQSKELSDKLLEVRGIWPNCSEVCLISPGGQIRAQIGKNTHGTRKGNPVTRKSEEDLLDNVASLQSTALQFGSILGQSDCGAVHVHGQKQAFHCYPVGDHVLCFYSPIDSTMSDDENMQDLDQRMEPLLELLQRHIIDAAPRINTYG
eukprot:gb/GEZN01015198.1/.p1 GENE.gb/GEZN01015198.1/~~gb/GEZN01015198.1/.p1  ORF type:complete len:156 (-),score=14.25 gb/GEZN01015198.1/:354-821(-)